MKRFALALLIAALTAASVPGCATPRGYKKTKTTGELAETYPYQIETESATWHLAKADIDSLGEDVFFEELYAILDDAEADMRDAREALKGYIPDEIPPVDIRTDFCNAAGMAESANAYYSGRGNFIKLFNGWSDVRFALLHEYVHYLTMHCADNPSLFGFWAEGVAEYIGKFLCKNRLARSVNVYFEENGYPPVLWDQAWDEEENCIDPRKLYFGLGAIAANGGLVGVSYYAVMNETIVRTEEMEKDLKPWELSLCEASGMIAYLAETYGRDKVFSNWNVSPDALDTVFGKPFPELYREWAEWNAEECAKMGLRYQ